MSIEQSLQSNREWDKKIAALKQYKLPESEGNLKKIEQRGDQWFFDDTPIEEHVRQMEELYTKDEERWKN